MKKIFAILALAITGTAFAADYVSVDVENVQGRKGGANSTAEYVRFGKGFGDYQLGVQSRTAKFANDAGGTLANSVVNSVEVYGSKNSFNLAGITPFVGVGHDNGGNTAQSYNYGLVGATYGFQAGPGYTLLGAKTRVGSTEEGARTKQSVAFATYSIPVAKNVAVNLNASRSWQTIKENALGVGVGFSF